MVVVFIYDEHWNFVRQYEGATEVEAILKIDPDFKGHAVVQNEKKKHYHFK